MPHVVLNGNIKIEDIFAKLKPLFVREGENILKTGSVYIDRKKSAILIDSLVIERGKKTSFFSTISGREDGVVVRIYPVLEVEKTNGVKKLIAEIAKQLMQIFPEFKLGPTNLIEFLP